MVNNAEYALDRSQFSSGKATEEYTSVHVFVSHAAKTKIFVRFVHWTYSSDYRWKFGIKDAARTVNTYWMKTSQVQITKR